MIKHSKIQTPVQLASPKLLSRSIAAIVLVAGLALLSTSLPGPEGETADPVNFQAVENSDIGPGSQNSADRLPPGNQTGHELTVDPDAVANNDLQSAPVSPPLAAGDSFPGGDGPFSISGLVVDEAGRGVPGIEVLASWKNLFQVDEDPDASRSERERKALTDFEGFYEIQGLDDGEYRSCASRRSGRCGNRGPGSAGMAAGGGRFWHRSGRRRGATG
jgi:hypothetical protein